jgi:hypothetical protein
MRLGLHVEAITSVNFFSKKRNDIISNYIHKLPKTVRNSIKPQTLFFHFTSEDFNRFNIEEQRIQINNLHPNFLIFWAFEFMKKDIVDFRYNQLQLSV